MIYGFILLAAATFAVWLAQNRWVTVRFGEDVRARFLEHCNYIPSQKPALLSFDSLKTWLDDPGHDRDAAGYAHPVLFPWDVLFLVLLGGALGLGSAAFADLSPALSKIPHGIWWILPVAYIVADTLEDVLIALLFKRYVALTATSYRALSQLTSIKLATVKGSSAQLLFLIVLAMLLYIYA